MIEIFRLAGNIAITGLRSAQQGLTRLDQNAQQVSTRLRSMGRAGLAATKSLAVPLAALGALAYKGVQAASDLNETMTKTEAIFGESAAAIVEWSKTTDTALGQSQKQALDAAGTFAMFGSSAGLAGQDLVGFSQQFTTLASDLASFYNTKPEDAILAIGAAFRGEMEPIRRYNVMLDDMTMRQKALELGIVSSTKNALTPQQKIIAAQALILEKTTKAQGDFNRTQEGLANQMRIAQAQVKNLTAEFGKAFLPIALDVLSIIRDDILPAVKWFVDGWNNLEAGTQKLIVALGAVTVAVAALSAVMVANPIGLVISLIGGLVAAGIYLYNNWEKVKERFIGIWDAIKYTTAQTISYLKTAFLLYLKTYVDGINVIGKYIPGLNKALDSAKTALDNLLVKEKESRQERRLAREEAKLLADETSKLAQAVDAAKAATVSYSIESAKAQITADAAIKAQNESLEDQKNKLQDIANERAAFENEWTDALREATATRSQLLEYEYNDALRKAEELGAEKQAIEKYYAIQRERLAIDEARAKDELRAQELEKEKQARREAFSVGANAINQLMDLFKMASDNKISNIDNELAKEKEAINSSTLSAEEKTARIAELDEIADKKKRELLIKQAKRDKASAVFAAVLSTFQAVAKALTLAFPLNLVMAGVVGALGAIQIGLIAKQSLPALAEGGYVEKRTGGIQAIIGEGNDNEVILPMKLGAYEIADRILSQIGDVIAPQPQPMYATAAGTLTPTTQPSRTVEQHWHIGTLIADDNGLKELERRLTPIRAHEQQRKGGA